MKATRVNKLTFTITLTEDEWRALPVAIKVAKRWNTLTEDEVKALAALLDTLEDA